MHSVDQPSWMIFRGLIEAGDHQKPVTDVIPFQEQNLVAEGLYELELH